MTKICFGFSDLSDSYSAFILDQWGVLHDGKAPYPGVLETLDELKKRNKQIAVLSNSGKRADATLTRLKKIGFKSTHFDHIVTAGEMAWQALKDRQIDYFRELGTKCLYFSHDNDTAFLDGLDLTVVDNAADAEFVLITGSDAPKKTMSDYEPLLKAASARGLKAVCANPDMVAIVGDAEYFGAGAIAKRYEDFGGVVTYIGKPYPAIFKYTISLLGGVLPASTLVVGDAMGHDIAGAVRADIDSCLIASGMHKSHFRGVKTRADLEKAIENLSKTNMVHPTYWLSGMGWGKPLPDRKHRKRRT